MGQSANKDRVIMCGVSFSNIDRRRLFTDIGHAISDRTPRYIVTPNVDQVVMLYKSDELRRIYEGAWLSLVDGMPLILAGRILGVRFKEKLSGSDLFGEICALSSEKGYSVFFLGGKPGSAQKSAEILMSRHPNLRVVGVYAPPYGFEKDAKENRKVIDMLKEAKPDMLFIGLGAPKQERWIHNNIAEYGAPISMGIGGTFEFTAGIVKRAPAWMQNMCLEWLWRLVMEPGRLWKRYLVDDMLFFWILLKEMWRVWIRKR